MSEDGPSKVLNKARFAMSVGMLSMAVLLAYPLVAWWGYLQHGPGGLSAALVAALVCWLGAALALLVTWLLDAPETAVSSLLLSMSFRMGLPLVGGLLLHQAGGPLASSGVFGMVLIFYLVTLAVETPLSLWILRYRQQSKAA